MKQHTLAAFLLSLTLLTGCAPAAESVSAPPLPTATSSPGPTAAPASEPAHGDAAEFYAFLEQAAAPRKALQSQTQAMDLSACAPDFYEQNHTFTEEELDLLLTYRGLTQHLTREDLLSDAETFFTLLKTTYGAYYYFGGDETFLPLLDAVKEELANTQNPTVQTLEEALYRHFSPVLVDGHFLLGDHAMRDAHAQYMYYVSGLYLDSIEGVEDPTYVKATIGPDGRICWWYATLSHDGSDLPETLDGHRLTWQKASCADRSGDPAFSVSQWEGVPILSSRRMSTYRGPEDERALQQLSNCGETYSDTPLLIFDVRGNLGGDNSYIRNWFQGWTGTECKNRQTVAFRYSQISCRYFDSYSPSLMGTHRITSRPGLWAERSGPVFVLQDKEVGSSGENAVALLRSAQDTLFVGGPTAGMTLVWNELPLYLPRSGLGCYFGTGLGFFETEQLQDCTGFLPDLWVDPDQALDAVKRLIQYYELN